MSNKNGEERLVFSIREAAQLLGISLNLTYELAKAGKLPTIKLGKRLLVPKVALQRMLEMAYNPNCNDG